MKKHAVSLYMVLVCALLCSLTGCGPNQLAGGTETQNPEIAAMAKAAFDAADAGNKWQPTFYLQDSTKKTSLGKTARRATASASPLSTTVIASKSDTLFAGADVSVIRDTALIGVKEIKLDTVIVDKILFLSDTIADTIRSATSGNRMSITVRITLDSIIVEDTVILTDTIVRQYKRAIVSVKQASDATRGTVVSVDTQYTDLGISDYNKSSDSGMLPNLTIKTVLPSWELDNINYSSIASPISYRFVSAPTKDTMTVLPGVNALRIRGNDLFLSAATFDNSILVKTVRFDAIDSLLSIVKFNPSSFDTVESLTTNYSIDLGTNSYSGADDQLRGIARSYSYRLGKFHRLELSLSPDPSNSTVGSPKVFNGMISMNIIHLNGTEASFSGVLDAAQGLIGIYETDGKKYQVTCDHSFKIQINEMTP